MEQQKDARNDAQRYSDSNTLDSRVCRGFVELKILRVQVVDTDVFKPNHAAAVGCEIDGDPVGVRRDGQVGETRYGAKLRKVNEVFPMSKEDCAQELEANLVELHRRLKAKRYSYAINRPG